MLTYHMMLCSILLAMRVIGSPLRNFIMILFPAFLRLSRMSSLVVNIQVIIIMFLGGTHLSRKSMRQPDKTS